MSKEDNKDCLTTNEDDAIDELNDETFGNGAVEGDWESYHDANVGSEKQKVTTSQPDEEAKVLSKFQDIKLMDLWDTPALPAGSPSPSTLNIWSSPELPSPGRKPFSSPKVVPKMRTVEDLEKDFLSSSMSPSPPPPPPLISSSPSLNSPHPGHSSNPHLSSSPNNVYHNAPPPSHRAPPPPGHSPVPHHPMYIRPPLMYYRGPLPMGRPPHPSGPPHRVLLPPPHPPMIRGPLPPNVPLMGPPPHLIPRGFPPHPHMIPYRPYMGPHPPPPPHGAMPFIAPPAPPRYPSKMHEMLSDLKPDGSGFMSTKEKEWVIKVQLLQLHNTNPLIEDYYYQRYVRKRFQEQSKGEGVVSSDNKMDDMTLPPPVSKEDKKRNNVEFENTLGKLSVSSVTAPRRSIDVGFSGEISKKDNVSSVITGSKKRLILMYIEELYNLLIKLEDNEVPPEEDVSSQVFKLLKLEVDENGAVIKDSATFFQQMLHFRKGKRVVQRILPFLNESHGKIVLHCITSNIYNIIKKDSVDKVLPELLPPINGIILKLCLNDINVQLKSITASFNSKISENPFLNNVTISLLTRGASVLTESSDTEVTEWHKSIAQLNKTIVLLNVKSSDILKILSDLVTPINNHAYQ